MSDDAEDQEEQLHPLDKLAAAVQEFAQSQLEEPLLVDTAILTWEQITYDKDGDMMRAIKYASVMPNFSLSSGLGLLEASREYVRRDILGQRDEDDE